MCKNISLLLIQLLTVVAIMPIPVCLANESSFEFYGKVYPEWRIDKYSQASLSGTNVGTMGTLKNNTQTLANNASTKENSSDWAWSNSYIGLKSQSYYKTIKFGFDYQLITDTAGNESALGNLKNNLDTRDAFLFIESHYGKFSFGKMDSIYKDWGDKYPMLGISSGNLVSTAKILSNAAWKGNGDRSFHNRRNNTITYSSSQFNQFEIGASYSFNEGTSGPGGPGTELAAIATRWSNDTWYIALAHEIHYDWLPLSQFEIDPSLYSIKNDSRNTSSRDSATRLSLAMRKPIYKIAIDVAKLRYSESSNSNLDGKFIRFQNYATQFSFEYKVIDNLILAYNFAFGSPGSCMLTGGGNCTTTNLGGYQNSFGTMYQPTKNLSVFFIASEIKNKEASRYASAPQGSTMNSYATGIKAQF